MGLINVLEFREWLASDINRTIRTRIFPAYAAEHSELVPLLYIKDVGFMAYINKIAKLLDPQLPYGVGIKSYNPNITPRIPLSPFFSVQPPTPSLHTVNRIKGFI